MCLLCSMGEVGLEWTRDASSRNLKGKTRLADPSAAVEGYLHNEDVRQGDKMTNPYQVQRVHVSIRHLHWPALGVLTG